MTLLQMVAVAALSAGARPPDAATPPLKSALTALDDGDFDTCLKAVDEGVRASTDDATLAQLYLAKGRCLGALQRFGQVEDAFAHALEHDAEAHLDPNRVLPTLVVMLDSLRSRLRGTLRVTTLPSGASVTVDGKDAGPSPVQVPISVGRHHVRARTPDGALAAEDDIAVPANRTTPLALALVRVAPPALPIGAGEPAVALQADVLGAFDPLNGFTVAAGPQLRGRFWFVSAHGAYGLSPGVDLQLGFRAPSVVGPLGAFAHADGRLFFSTAGTLPGAGGGVGLSVTASPRLEVFGEVGVCEYFGGPPQSTLWTLGTGLRIRIL